MYEEVKEVIKERLSHGDKKEEIITELKEAGYPEDLALDLYNQSFSEFNTSSTTDKDDDDQKNKENQENQENHNKHDDSSHLENEKDTHINTSQAENKQNKNITPVLIKVLGVTVLVSALAYFAFYSLLLSAPFKKESDMFIGMLVSINNKKVYSYEANFEVVFEPRTNSAVTLSSFDLDTNNIRPETFPDTGHMQYKITSSIDRRNNKKIPDTDTNLNMSVNVKPLDFNANLDIRIAEDNFYARLNEVPDLVKLFIPLELPIQKWILIVENVSDYLSETVGNIISKSDSSSLLPPSNENEKTALEQITNVIEIAKLLSFPNQNNVSSLKQVANVSFSLIEGLTEDEETLLKQTLYLFEKYPIFNFVDKPKRIEVNGEKLFEYEVELNRNNLLDILSELATLHSESFEEAEQNMKMILEDIPEQKVFDDFNRLFSIKLTFNRKGEFRGLFISSVFTPKEEFTSQARLKLEFTMGKEDESIKITIPDEIYNKSLEEIISDIFTNSMRTQEVYETNSSVKTKIGHMRSQAEISFNNNSFTYLNVCPDLRSKFENLPWNFECNSDATRYIIYAKLDTLTNAPETENDFPEKFWCIDSTAQALETRTEPDLQKLSCL